LNARAAEFPRAAHLGPFAAGDEVEIIQATRG
jgi:hypothetical protein